MPQGEGGLHLGVGEDVEGAVAHRVEHAVGHRLRVDPGVHHGLDERGPLGRRRRVVLGSPVRSVAIGLGDARLDEARAQHRDADRGPGGAQVLVQALGDGDHGVLRRGVRPEAGGRAQPGDRGRVDHVALALFEEQGHERVDAVDDAPEIDAEDPAPFLLGDLPDRAADAHPGVVVHEVGAAEVLQRSGRAGRGPRPASETSVTTARTSAPSAARARRRRLEHGLLDVGQDELHALGGGAPGHRLADAAGPAGDHGHLAAQVLHVPSVDPVLRAVKHEPIDASGRPRAPVIPVQTRLRSWVLQQTRGRCRRGR